MSRSCLHSSRTRRSARLKFGDDRYYEFLCFDVPKIVRSPGYDHGHDEESRNGRDMKIDILEAYVWTSFDMDTLRYKKHAENRNWHWTLDQ